MSRRPAATRLGRDARVQASRQFAEAFEQSRGSAGRFMVIWPRRGDDAAARIGAVASKRTFRRAVDRNRARRLLREAFRLHRDRLSGAFDYVIVARRRILEADPAGLERDLLAIAARIGALDEDDRSSV